MGDLFEDTAVVGENGKYTATPNEDWAAFGPVGGYLAAIALRAAGATTQCSRPASFGCHYLGPAEFAPLDVAVEKLFAGRRAESLRVSITQKERPILVATVWTIGESVPGFDDHAELPMPESPAPETLTCWEELAAPLAPRPKLKFWKNVDQRLIGWQGWHEAGPPLLDGWYRFRPRTVMPDPFTEAARSLIIIDASTWLAAMNPNVGRARIVAPTMELSVRFYHAGQTEWLRCHARSDIALGGLIDGGATVWSSDGKVVAIGSAQILYRTTGQLPSGALP